MAGDLNSTPVFSRPVQPAAAQTRVQPRFAPGPTDGSSSNPSFREILADTIQQVNVRQQEADKAIEALTTGETTNLAEVMSAVEKADLAFRTLMQFRNKLVSAYQEINNMRY
jgi:flagellar hook-basal body complex protein FliE